MSYSIYKALPYQWRGPKKCTYIRERISDLPFAYNEHRTRGASIYKQVVGTPIGAPFVVVLSLYCYERDIFYNNSRSFTTTQDILTIY